MGLKLHDSFYGSFILLLLCLNSFSQSNKSQLAPFTLFGKIMLDDKAVENVSLELMKNNQLLKKIVTTKNGKYSFTMNQDTINRNNEYVIHISKEGTVPKTLIVNTYLPKEEYDDSNFDYLLEITLVPTTINDIVIQRPSGKIKWNTAESSYGIDQIYAKIIQKEEEKLKEDPDKYLKELAERMKKGEEEKKRKEEAEAKKKAEELARKTAEEVPVSADKEKEKVEVALKEKLNAFKMELKELSKVSDSMEKSGDKKLQDQTLGTVVNTQTEDYDETIAYELKKARVVLEKKKIKEERTKSTNLAAKYETSNVMSSLLDAVDEHDKRMKNK